MDPTAPVADAELGRRGFATGAGAYERGRPDYPAAAVDRIVDEAGLAPGRTVLDLAAGTGKLTRALVPTGAAVLAVEPSADMRSIFRQAVPGVPVVGGTAEAVPLADATVDAVVVAQAFHWFRPQVALGEMARVLVGGGTLALVWNERDGSDPVMAELGRLSRWARCRPYPAGMDFGPVIDASGRYGAVTRMLVDYEETVDAGALVDQVASRSYVQVMYEPERRDLLASIGRFAATLGDRVVMKYRTDLFLARSRT